MFQLVGHAALVRASARSRAVEMAGSVDGHPAVGILSIAAAERVQYRERLRLRRRSKNNMRVETNVTNKFLERSVLQKAM